MRRSTKSKLYEIPFFIFLFNFFRLSFQLLLKEGAKPYDMFFWIRKPYDML